jgi:hypothetical protein
MSRRPRIDRTDRWIAALAVALFAVIVLIFSPVLVTPATLDHVTVQNHGTWAVTVSISGSDFTGWLPLGTASVGDTRVPDVIDPGPVWIVRFGNGEVSYNERLDRKTLEANHWVISVPTKVQDLIRSSGADAPPDA